MKLWQKMALILVAVALVPLLFASWQIARRSADRLSESIKAYHLATADVALAEVRSMLARAKGEALAIADILSDDGTFAEDRERLLRHRLPNFTTIGALSVHNLSGTPVLSLGKSPDNVGDNPIPSAVRDVLANNPEAYGPIARGDGLIALPYVVKLVKPSGATIGFLRVYIDLRALHTFIEQLSLRHFGAAGNHLRLMDERFLRIGGAPGPDAEHPDDLSSLPAISEVRAELEPFRRDLAWAVDYETAQGDSMIGVLVPLPELGWAAFVEERQDVAYAPITATWETALWVAILAIVLVMLIALVMGRQIARPIVAIATNARKVADGNFAARVPPSLLKRSDEIRDSAIAFNHMAQALGDYRDRLVNETRARENLSRFLAPEVVEKVVDGEIGLTLGGEEADITVLFADVVGFTGIAESYPPDVVVRLLNELFTIISEIVFQHSGIIDKFIGDCAMALWGAPEPQADSAVRAAAAALQIRDWLETANPRWQKQFGRPIELGMAIHTGRAVIGNIGSEKRMDYTAIGDAVNVAARLERLAAPGQILVTGTTYASLKDRFELETIGQHKLTGRSAPIEVHTLIEERL